MSMIMFLRPEMEEAQIITEFIFPFVQSFHIHRIELHSVTMNINKHCIIFYIDIKQSFVQIHLHFNATNCAATTCYCCCPSHQRMHTDVCGGFNIYSVESKHRYSCSGLLTHESGWSFVGQTTWISHIIKCTLDFTLFAWADYWLFKSCVHNLQCDGAAIAQWSRMNASGISLGCKQKSAVWKPEFPHHVRK